MTRAEERIEEAKNRFSDDQIYPISKIYAFVGGARWADETMIDKASEWLRKFLEGPMGEGLAESIVNEFIQAMEE